MAGPAPDGTAATIMTVRLGMLGLSEGNGHPFSFSAIVNGYDPDRLRAAGWDAINAYLDLRDPADLGVPNARVTHAWCPDAADARTLCEATHIPTAVGSPEEMLGHVDAVMIARDDWECHWALARPFVEAGVAVFVDKPLALDPVTLDAFRPYLDAGLVMSCSGYRFAPELDRIRPVLDVEPPLVLSGIGPRDWDHYAVHLVEPLLTLTAAQPSRIVPVTGNHDAAVIQLSDGATVTVHCLGDSAPGFIVNVTTAASRFETPMNDRFTAFRRLLCHFVEQVGSHLPAIDPAETLAVMKVLMAGRIR